MQFIVTLRHLTLKWMLSVAHLLRPFWPLFKMCVHIWLKQRKGGCPERERTARINSFCLSATRLILAASCCAENKHDDEISAAYPWPLFNFKAHSNKPFFYHDNGNYPLNDAAALATTATVDVFIYSQNCGSTQWLYKIICRKCDFWWYSQVLSTTNSVDYFRVINISMDFTAPFDLTIIAWN